MKRGLKAGRGQTERIQSVREIWLHVNSNAVFTQLAEDRLLRFQHGSIWDGS
ncbi:hypothetical protein Arad_3643 [Rhizobium rhizogenes K84]|uniref:Uncharacterized protein n=1 Tax=Rhizobium rhizogenes (strain K84 / ATCC BAA-868) TaxID=311403 RepID=B9J9E3_RHIR8|nr:hypothetical protein Arad_3643 [Rhizobium rhizogenes K84]